MNAEQLSKRLERVAYYIPRDAVLADIGSDHAYLPCYAIKENLAAKAIAGEVVEGPYQSAVNQVKETSLEDYISVRKGNGLEVMERGEATAITICGMGGTLITSILENGKAKLTGQERLILQPNIGANSIRAWCIQEGWKLIGEEILEEDGKIYEILVAEKGDPIEPYDHHPNLAELLMGPFLLKEKNDIFLKKWRTELEHWHSILEKLNESKDPDRIADKRRELLDSISSVEEALGK